MTENLLTGTLIKSSNNNNKNQGSGCGEIHFICKDLKRSPGSFIFRGLAYKQTFFGGLGSRDLKKIISWRWVNFVPEIRS